MSHTTTRAERRRRGTRVALATLVALLAMAVTAGGAQATGSEREHASFTITKQTDPANDPTVFTFKVEYTPIYDAGANSGDDQPPAQFTLAGGGTITFDNVHKGLYTVSELTQTGWQLVDIQCAPEDPDPEDAYQIDLTLGSVAIELSPDESKSCTFVNRKQSPPIVPPGPPGPSDTSGGVAPTPANPQPPGIAVLPTTIRPASARLSVPSVCVSRRYTVTVRGTPVQRVSWYVNGRFVRSTKARSGQRRFTVQLAPGANVQRIQARVTFASNASLRTRVLRATIRRCSPAAVRPQFTG